MAISESIKFRLKLLKNGLRRDIAGKYGRVRDKAGDETSGALRLKKTNSFYLSRKAVYTVQSAVILQPCCTRMNKR